MTDKPNVETLYLKFKDEFAIYVKRFQIDKAKATPFVISRILSTLVPNIMVAVGKYKKMSGDQKKNLVIDTCMYTIDMLFAELNISTDLSKETWDEHVRDILLALIPTTIDSLISVEKGKLKFNSNLHKCCNLY